MPSRLLTKAKIKRASRIARDKAGTLDKVALRDLEAIYRDGLSRLRDRIAIYGDDQGRLRLTHLQRLKADLERVHSELERIQKRTLFERMEQVAAMGITPMAEQLGAERVARMVNGAVKASSDFIAADGLQLSDRLWRVNNHARGVVAQALQSAVIQGDSASAAALDFLQKGEKVPADIAAKIGRANVSAVNRVLGRELMAAAGSPYHNAKRLFRTEINRAHGTAYQAAVFEHEDTAGTRFLLSPNHPEADVCDMHAKANLHGLGPGVYPRGKSPWPAHPNTLSYEVVVFVDEVTDADKAGKQSRSDWLNAKPPTLQAAVLGGQKKQQAFAAGKLKENQFGTPWRVLKKRFDRAGVAIVPPIKVVAPASGFNDFDKTKALPVMSKGEALTTLRSRFAETVELEGMSTTALNSVANGFNKVLGTYGLSLGRVDFFGRGEGRKSAAFYQFTRKGWSQNSDRIAFGRSYIRTGSKLERANHPLYLARRESKLKAYDDRIARAETPARKAALRDIKSRVEAATRWTSGEVLDDAVFSTASHEAGHALMMQGGLMSKWQASLKAHKVSRLDWFRVSEYAGVNEDELFAEVTSFMAAGRENMIPDNVRQAYNATLQNFRRL